MEEAAIISKLKDENQREAAFSILVREYQQALYWHVRKIVFEHEDADDVIQNTFIKAWRHLDSFRGEAKLRTWLYRIATNEALTFLKSKKRHVFSPIEDIEDHSGLSNMGNFGPTGDEILDKLYRAIETLPEKQRIVFNLKYFDEMKYEEISEIIGGTVGSLKASFHHAVKKVEKFLEND